MKDIALNLDVKVSYRTNYDNEKRMPDELLNELKSKIRELERYNVNSRIKELEDEIYSLKQDLNISKNKRKWVDNQINQHYS